MKHQLTNDRTNGGFLRAHVTGRPRGVARRLTMTILLLAGCGSIDDGDLPPGARQLELFPVVTGLSAPVQLTTPAGDARMFIVEQAGRIRVVKDGQLLATPFLDVTAKVSAGGERGLLSVAFDPAYATNGNFFVYYTNRAGDITVERYTANAGADVANAGSATTVITIPHPAYANHNGGLAAFGPDGMLYLGTGDGGGGGDPDNNAQNTNVLLGKLLRLDVHTLPYTIPAGNPFVGQAGKRGEIWAYGLRNPWRFSWSPASGATPARIWIADVGQGAREEIDVMPADSAGVNYGWNAMEGTQCYTASLCSTVSQLPAVEYTHDDGSCSIIGGYFYRGSVTELQGQYFFSDYCLGFVRSVDPNGFTIVRHVAPAVGNVLGFGENATGELYLLSAAGTVYLVRRPLP